MERQKPTVGRVVHVYSDLWEGPRAGIVAGVVGVAPVPETHGGGEVGLANVNTFADGTRDPAFLRFIRQSPTGNTLSGLPIFDAQLDPLCPHALDAAKFMADVGVMLQAVGTCHRFVAVWPPRV